MSENSKLFVAITEYTDLADARYSIRNALVLCGDGHIEQTLLGGDGPYVDSVIMGDGVEELPMGFSVWEGHVNEANPTYSKGNWRPATIDEITKVSKGQNPFRD
jgi:hypothetical protein